MKPDEFEKKLSHQSLRKIPGEWRPEILAAASDAQTIRHSSFVIRRSWLSTLNSRLSTLFWPHPKAWAGLAAVWVFIFIVNFSMRDKEPVIAEKVSPPSPEMVAELKQQRLMFAQLIGARDETDVDRSKVFVPLPRSERAEILTA